MLYIYTVLVCSEQIPDWNKMRSKATDPGIWIESVSDSLVIQFYFGSGHGFSEDSDQDPDNLTNKYCP